MNSNTGPSGTLFKKLRSFFQWLLKLFIPSATTVIKTRLNQSAILKRIEEYVSPAESLGVPYYGELRGSSFKLSRSSIGSSFHPVVEGFVMELDFGSELELKLRLPWYQQLLLVFMFLFSGFLVGKTIDYPPMELSREQFAPISMFVGLIIFSQTLFRLETTKIVNDFKKYLAD